MSRRGGILLETVIALALFAAGAIFVLQAMRDGIAAMDRSRQRQEAVDLARSALARLETGIINMEDLRAGRLDPDGSEAELEDVAEASPFIVDATSERSAYAGLSLVEVRLRAANAADGDGPGPILCTLRQLVRLGDDASGEEDFLEDDLLEGLPREIPASDANNG